MNILGIGVDTISISEFTKILGIQPKMVNTVFTSGEIEYCNKNKNSVEHLAGRFAAKEAFYKALPAMVQNEIDWRDVEIENIENGKPIVSISNRIEKILKTHGISKIHLSISINKNVSTAFIILSG